MKKITVILSYPLCIRNFIHSGLLNELNKAGYIIKLISPYKEEAFEDEWGNRFPNDYIPTSGWDKWGTPMIGGTGWFFKLLVSLRLRGYAIEFPNGSLQTMELSKPSNAVWLLSWLMIKLFPRKSAGRRFLRKTYDRTGPTNTTIEKLFEEDTPDLLITSTMGHFPMDFLGLTSAKRRGIKTMCILLSWDNLYSRGPVYKHPDRLLVWSNVMKSQALAVHQFRDEDVAAVGPLQFVNYADYPSAGEMATARQRLSLSENDKYILYVCGGRTPQYDLEDIHELLIVLRDSAYKDHKVIVRPHPQVDAKQYDSIKDSVLMDYSPSLIGVKNPGKLFEKADIRHFASLIVQAHFVVSSWGTTALLEACIFDRKVVQLNWFDSVAHADKTQSDSVRNFQNYYHMKEFDRYEGRLFSYAPSDLISKFRELDEDNERFSRNRKKIRADFTIGTYAGVPATIAKEVNTLIER